jgi:carboxypeptidase Q
MAARLVPLFAPVGAGTIVAGHGGTDIGPMGRAGVPLVGLNVDTSTYFDIHHTAADTLDKVKPEELALDAGVLAIMAYVLADMPETLPRDAVPPPAPSE